MSTYQQKFGLEFEPQSNRPPSKQCGFVDVDVDSTVTVTLLWHCGLVDLWTVDLWTRAWTWTWTAVRRRRRSSFVVVGISDV